MVFVPVQQRWHQSLSSISMNMTYNDSGVETAGFLVLALLQSAATLFLFLALDHERQFRSAGTACRLL